MKTYEMSLLLLSGFFNTFSGSINVIPTKQEQANLLTDVREVFEQVRVLVEIESNSSDESLVSDVNRTVQRAKDKLELVEQLCLTKMSCGSNAVCMLEYKQIIRKLTEEGKESLKMCVKRCSDDVVKNSFYLRNCTETAMQSGEDLLETLYNCSRKSGLQVISCYKEVIVKDVAPVKRMLLKGIEGHKDGQFRTIQIRNEANDCVDDVVEKHRRKIEEALSGALSCS